MKRHFTRIGIAAVLGLSPLAVACNAEVGDVNTNIDDLTIDDISFDIDTEIDVNAVVQGDVVPIHVEQENVNLIEPNVTPPDDKKEVSGHFEVFIDSED